jgi:hypothetical protein
MNNLHSRRELFVPSLGGLIGFFLVIGATITVLVVGFMRGASVFGGGLQSWKDSFVTAIFVPALISLGAAMPAWVLGAKWWHGLLAGIVAALVFIYIELNGGKQFNYGLFSQRETFAHISAALVTVLIATLWRNKFQTRGYITMFAISVTLVGLRFMVLEEDFLVGIIFSLLAWILLPAMVVFTKETA